MADLLTPKTWTSGEVPTAANMNSGIRDPINRLNGFADFITDNTAADAGTGTYLKITRPVSSGTGFKILEGWEAGDTIARVSLSAKGYLSFTDGETSAGHFIFFNAADGVIETPSRFRSPEIQVGQNPDDGTDKYVEFTSQTAPPPLPPVGHARLYLLNSSGMMRLAVLFSTGPSVIIATKP